MVSQPQKDTPFGLEPNLAAGLAYLLCIIGGIVMLVGGGTNRFVKWSAAQSITLWATWFVIWIAIDVVDMVLAVSHLWLLLPIMGIISMLIGILALVAWLYTWITAFQGREVRLPIIADLTQRFFGTQLA
ncbi:MAG TPA: hypothetical protein VGN11_07970 [Candidatus Baltobacteraceae bacterium]|jgi:uncharacterized membrane protein|nr:hypothetical protein [Candidatus Baltobacteraceae bacterium]